MSNSTETVVYLNCLIKFINLLVISNEIVKFSISEENIYFQSWNIYYKIRDYNEAKIVKS